MKKLISYSTSPYKSLNIEELNICMNMELLDCFDYNSFNWGKVGELHIIGNKNGNDEEEFNFNQFGVYYNDEKDIVIVLCPSNYDRCNQILSECSNLWKLDIRFTDLIKINLSLSKNISELQMSHNKLLSEIVGIEYLSNLKFCDIGSTNISEFPNLDNYSDIRSLTLNNCLLDNISVSKNLDEMRYLNLGNTLISKIDFVSNMRRLKRVNFGNTRITDIPPLDSLHDLETLNLYNTNISKLPVLKNLIMLKSLNIRKTNISSLSDVEFPENLQTLVLDETPIKEIGKNITSLSKLKKLRLNNMRLYSLPIDILKLDLEFVFKENGFGICLFNTEIEDMDLNILEQPRSIVRSWFENRKLDTIKESKPLNEGKIVFLGDGGAGKSLSIHRLLNNGIEHPNFDGNATPGISIQSKLYTLNEENVVVHYWDFGGQEIMHSMHRMFLTKRTLYVVFVNSRDNTQDERARYWLQNIKSFAFGSPVVIVLNQIDQNPSASVNEPSLKTLYPYLKKIIKLSAVEYSQDEFLNTLQDCLLNEVINLPCIREPFLGTWNNLKVKLESMKENYINKRLFHEICDECKVENDEFVRENLLGWFADLGISFCYRDTSALSEFMVLRPDWITNAIYIVLFNGGSKARNGLINHESIHKLLSTEFEKEERVEKVLQNISYSPSETEYVLGVIRKFKLSYRMDDHTEFIPMLCDRNEKDIIVEFVDKEDVLEFIIDYEYLPNNVIHQLMVKMENDLLHEHVWLSGAVFESSSMKLSALVKSEDNQIKIYVKSNSEIYKSNFYLGHIRDQIKSINSSLGLQSFERIVYKENGIADEFEYEYLQESYAHGNREVFSSKMRKNIDILGILKITDGEDAKKKQTLVQDIIEVSSMLQSFKPLWNSTEDSRNTYLRDMLRNRRYIVCDQTFCGKSSSGKQPGELDLEIMESASKPIAICEALNLKNFGKQDQKYWEDHLVKLLDNYNPMGLPLGFLISYVNCSKDDFKAFWLKYYEYSSQQSVNKYVIQKSEEYSTGQFYLRGIKCIYDRSGYPISIYHICIRLGED